MINFITEHPFIFGLSWLLAGFCVTWLFGGIARLGDNRDLKTGEPND